MYYDSENPQTKIHRLESENVKMREEFNVQRAKMKELFLQKEGKHGMGFAGWFFLMSQ